MLIDIEFILSIVAVAGGVAMFVAALRRRPARGVIVNSDAGTVGILKTNLYALTVIALVFFGTAFVVDAFL